MNGGRVFPATSVIVERSRFLHFFPEKTNFGLQTDNIFSLFDQIKFQSSN
jgi:hypothetical protein